MGETRFLLESLAGVPAGRGGKKKKGKVVIKGLPLKP